MNKPSLMDRNEQVFSKLRASLASCQVPCELIDEVVELQPGITFERGAMVFCEGTSDGLLACVISGFVKVYCPVGDGIRTIWTAGTGVPACSRPRRPASATWRCSVGIVSSEVWRSFRRRTWST